MPVAREVERRDLDTRGTDFVDFYKKAYATEDDAGVEKRGTDFVDFYKKSYAEDDVTDVSK